MYLVPSMSMQGRRTSLYVWLYLGQLPQQGPYSKLFIWGEAAGHYFTKAHAQREKKHCGSLRGLPDTLTVLLPGLISPRHRRSHPHSLTTGQGGPLYRLTTAPPTRSTRSPRPLPPTLTHQRTLGKGKEIKTVHDQRILQPRHPDYPLTLTVM